MDREVDMSVVSDGRLYTSNDMVKLGSGDCRGCYKCCQNMGNSIILDPMDVHNISHGTNVTFEQLLANGSIELNVVEGIILPDLKMTGQNGACSFLNEKGRCSIHDIRPGICRLFPLGRIYDGESFKYFLQVDECPNNKTKVKIKKWLGIDNITEYENYISRWHYFLKNISGKILSGEIDENNTKNINMYILNNYYIKPFAANDFYTQFETRINEAETGVFCNIFKAQG